MYDTSDDVMPHNVPSMLVPQRRSKQHVPQAQCLLNQRSMSCMILMQRWHDSGPLTTTVWNLGGIMTLMCSQGRAFMQRETPARAGVASRCTRTTACKLIWRRELCAWSGLIKSNAAYTQLVQGTEIQAVAKNKPPQCICCCVVCVAR